MRSRLALAGVLAGLAALAPVAPASAQCDPQILAGGGSGCTNGCTETGNTVDKATAGLRDKFSAVPSYWDLFACTQ